jgi:hypothetical protein
VWRFDISQGVASGVKMRIPTEQLFFKNFEDVNTNYIYIYMNS